MPRADELKKAAGEQAASYVKDGMMVGLGTGSTVYFTIKRIGDMVRTGLHVQCIPTSERTEELARAEGIPLTSFARVHELDLTIDGADEVNPALDLVKGGGGALLREKLVASASRRLVIVADASKRVSALGAFPLPIEVVRFAWQTTERRLTMFGCSTRLRMAGAEVYVTDNGNHIIDCSFGVIADPAGLHKDLKALPGVVETGLFPGMASVVLFGGPGGVEVVER